MLRLMETKNKLSSFDLIVFWGIALTFIVMWLGILINDQNSVSNKLASSGGLLIGAFFLLSLTIGALQGIPKTEIKISKKYGLITFTVAVCMFLMSGLIEYL